MSVMLWSTLARVVAPERSFVRKRPSWRTRLLRLGVFAALPALAYATYWASRTDALAVQSVEVRGAREVSEREIAATAGVLGSRLFLVDAAEVERRIEQIPYVASATVTSRFSTTVSVRVREREPALIWRAGRDSYLVDETGAVLEKATGPARLPVLERGTAERLKPGEIVDPRRVATALALFGELPVDLRPEVEKLTYDPAVGYEIVSTGDWRAVIGDDSQLGVKAEVLRKLVRKPGAVFIDVSTPAMPYYRRGEEAID